MTVAKEKYPAWIYQNFKNFMRFFRLSESSLRSIFRPQTKNKENSYKNIILSRRDNVVTIVNVRTGRIGMAKCHDEDAFDIVTGVAIAWARYCAKNEQQLAETNKAISQLDCDKLGNVSVHSYVRRDTKQVFFVIGANPIRTGYIICINCRSGQPVNLPKNIIVHII